VGDATRTRDSWNHNPGLNQLSYVQRLNVLAYGVLGESLHASRSYPEAIAAYDQAIRLNLGHASEMYRARGRSEYLLGNFEMAKASCEVEPDQYHVQLCMPLVYEKLGQHAAAEAVLATAMAAQGDAAAYQYAGKSPAAARSGN